MTSTRSASSPLPPLASPDVRRDRRPGGGRRDAPQRRPDRSRRPRDPLRRAARDRQDVARADPRQGRQLHRPARRRRLRRLPVVRGHPRGRHPRPRRDRRGEQPRHRRRPRTSASVCRTRPASSSARSTSSTRRTRSRRTPGTRSSSRSRNRPTSSPSCSPRPSPRGFPAAILSRLQRYDVRRLTVPEIEGKLARILEADGRTADPAAIHLIARLAAGGMRDAESMLDQLLSSAPETIDERRVRDLLGLADAEAVDGFVDALVAATPRPGSPCSTGSRSGGVTPGSCSTRRSTRSGPGLVEGLTSGDGSATPGLADAARRLAAIDPDRAGVGGLRLQLELALFATGGPVSIPRAMATPPIDGVRPPVQRPTATTSQPAAPRPAPARPAPADPVEAPTASSTSPDAAAARRPSPDARRRQPTRRRRRRRRRPAARRPAAREGGQVEGRADVVPAGRRP